MVDIINMKLIRNIILGILLAIFLVMAHIDFLYLLPYPVNNIHLLLGTFVIIIMWSEKGGVVWLSFFSFFLLNLFTVSPFGTIFISGTITTLILYWFRRDLFTNRSFWTCIVLGFLAILIFRTLYTILFYLFNFFMSNQDTYIFGSVVFFRYIWELIFTVAFVAVLYHMFVAFQKKKI